MRTIMIGIFLFVAFFVIVQVHEMTVQAEEKGNYTSPEMWKGAGGAGKGVYMMNCVPCHGENGMGDGPLAYDFPEGQKPRNHTDGKYMSTRADKDLFKVVDEGGEAVGRSSGMPGFRGLLSDKEIKDVVAYLRELCKCTYKGK